MMNRSHPTAYMHKISDAASKDRAAEMGPYVVKAFSGSGADVPEGTVVKMLKFDPMESYCFVELPDGSQRYMLRKDLQKAKDCPCGTGLKYPPGQGCIPAKSSAAHDLICEVCGALASLAATKRGDRCYRCWELEQQIMRSPNIARKILKVDELEAQHKVLAFAFLDLLGGSRDHDLSALAGWQPEKCAEMAALRKELMQSDLGKEWSIS